MSSYPHIHDDSVPDASRQEDPFSVARKHALVLRHAIGCYADKNPNQCQFPICKEMRSLLDHVFCCPSDKECNNPNCVVCKQLMEHISSCADTSCRICNGNGVNRRSAPENATNNHNFVNGCQTHSNLSSTNGFDWREQFGIDLRDQLVKNYAQQVFNPETYKDSRSLAVFKFFEEQENKLFYECSSEEEYRTKLKRCVSRVQKELQKQLEKQNGFSPNTIPNANAKNEPLDHIDPRSQSSLHFQSSGGSAGFTSTSAPESSNDKSIEVSETKPKLDSSAQSNEGTSSSSVKIEDVADVQCNAKSENSSSSEPASVDQHQQQSEQQADDRRCVWSKEQLQKAFGRLLNDVVNDPNSFNFRTPVDYEDLRLLDYPTIITQPMDLSTIEKKLQNGDYHDPWEVVDDFWLMFNNAWKYNKKNTKVYKSCTKLSEYFETLIDPLMRDLGFCCGRAYVHYPHVLTCLTEKSCNINRDDVYYVCETTEKEQKTEFLDKYIVCEKCYQSAGSTITIDDQSSPVHLEKSRFLKQVNNNIVHEKFVNCRECGRKWHKVCACHMDEIWPSGFVCENCRRIHNIPKALNRFTAKRLPKCKLSEFLEKRVNDFMKKNEPTTNEVIIRVVASGYKNVEVKKYMRETFCQSGKFPESFPYKTKAIFAFQEVEGQEVCFFGLYVQEYSSDCPPPNTRRVYIAYLDSVYYFQPKQYRTAVYHEILIGYLHYAKKQGYAYAHIWACPPGEGDDYIFHMHPTDQKIPKPKRLQDWYRKMLQKAHNERVVFDYKNIFEDATETKRLLIVDLPYFDGDLWPNTMEELLKPLVETRRRLKEEEAAEECGEGEDDGDSNHGSLDCDRKPGSAGSGNGINGVENRKKTKKRKMKRGSSKVNLAGGNKRKRLTAASAEDTEAEVQRRLEENLQRHADAFLTINLYNPNQIPNLQPITDPDPLISSELMECRDSFLSRARDRHLEFSTLRRARFSTLTFLYDIHQENKDTIIYVCSACKTETETPRNCKECANFYLCEECYKSRGHNHPMIKIAANDDSENNAAVQQSDRLRMEKVVALLKHTSQCRDANCRQNNCRDIKRRLLHMQSDHDRSKCLPCRQMTRFIVAHSAKCNDSKCQVIFCNYYKSLKKQQESQQRIRKLQTLRRRQKTMQCDNNPNSTAPNPQEASTPQQAGVPDGKGGGSGTLNQPLPHPANPALNTASPTVLSGPGSTETPQSFNSQLSMASPHVVPPRNSPPKPTSVPTHPSALQYTHAASPYQSPIPPNGPRSIGCNQPQQQGMHQLQNPNPAEFQQLQQQQQQTSVTSPFVQQQHGQGQPSMSGYQQMHAPQMHPSKSFPAAGGEMAFVRQQSNQQLFENGQPQQQQRGPSVFMNNNPSNPGNSNNQGIMVPMSPRQQQQNFQPQTNFQPPPPLNDCEDPGMYNAVVPPQQTQQMHHQQQQGSLKRPYFTETDVMNPGGVNMYHNSAGGMPGGPTPSKQMRLSNMQPQSSLQISETQMHWSGPPGGCQQQQPPSNGQIGMQQQPIGGNAKMSHMRQQSMHHQPQMMHAPIPPSNQSVTTPVHLINSTASGGQPSNGEIEAVLSARRNFNNEMEFNAWLQQNSQLLPAWNYIRSQHQQKGMMQSKPPLQYSQSQPLPMQSPQQQQQMMMRGGPGGPYMNHVQAPPAAVSSQRMVPQQPPTCLQISSPPWQQAMQPQPQQQPLQTQQIPQDSSWNMRQTQQPCYASPSQGANKLPPYNQNLPPQMVQNSSYSGQQPQSGFQAHRYALPPQQQHGVGNSCSNPAPPMMRSSTLPAQHRMAGPPLSPRSQQSMYGQQGQQAQGPNQQSNSMMLTQLLVQPQSQRMTPDGVSHQQQQSHQPPQLTPQQIPR